MITVFMRVCGANSHSKATRYLWGKRHPYDLRVNFILARTFTPIQKQPKFCKFFINKLLLVVRCFPYIGKYDKATNVPEP